MRQAQCGHGQVPEATLRIDQGAELLSLYEWNSRRAKYHFCSRCGIYVFHRKRAAPDHYGANVFCLDGFDASSLPVRPTEGIGMDLVFNIPREDWAGPRVSKPVDG